MLAPGPASATRPGDRGAAAGVAEREPRSSILLMIALPAVLVGIIGTLVVMYASGVRSR